MWSNVMVGDRQWRFSEYALSKSRGIGGSAR